MSLNFKIQSALAVCFLLLITTVAAAQQNVRKINNYPHEASIVADKNKLSVTVDGQMPKTFELIKVNGELQLKNDQERKLFLDLLQLNPQQKSSLSEQYKVELKSLDSKLISRAVELRGLKLVNNTAVGNTVQTDSNAAADTMVNALPEVLTSTADEPAETPATQTYLWLIPALLLGGLLGFFLGKRSEKNKLTQKYNQSQHAESESLNNTVSSSEMASSTAQKEILYERLQKEFERLSDEFEDRKYFDRQYYAAVDKNIIAPFWEAVHQKNEQKAVECALKSVAQLTAVTRLRLDIEQSFDQHNIDQLMHKGATAKQKSIDGKTNKDDIPDHINTIISILHQYQLDGLGETNFQGYTLNNLNA